MSQPILRRLKAVTTLAALLSLAACGGGGDGATPEGVTPPPPPAGGGGGGGGTGTARAASVTYDLDNNGTPDATQTYRYDADGRPVELRYDYTGDGTPDRLAGLGSTDSVTTLVFDPAGRVASFTDDETTFSFTYGSSGLPLRADVASMGFGGRIDLTHDAAGLLVRADTSLGGVAAGVDTFEYDAAGRRTLELETAPGDTTGARSVYTWNTDGTLAGVARDIDVDGRDVRYEMAYAGGRQTSTRKTVGGAVRYVVRFGYDAAGRLASATFDVGGDGSDDAVWTLSWESGACRAVTLPLYDPLMDSITGHGSSANGTLNPCAAP